MLSLLLPTGVLNGTIPHLNQLEDPENTLLEVSRPLPSLCLSLAPLLWLPFHWC